jgi:hypothetical protein
MGLNFLARPNKHYKGRVREPSIKESREQSDHTKKRSPRMSGFVEKARFCPAQGLPKRLRRQISMVNCIRRRRGVICRPVADPVETSALPSNRKAAYLRIATEEAYAPPEMLQRYRKLIQNKECDDPGFLSQWEYFLGNAPQIQQLARRLQDLGGQRIEDMDATGISRQILSLTSPGVQVFDPATGTSLAASFNDQLAEAIGNRPDRFSGLAAIAPQNPAGAAKELERGVRKLGLK